MTTNTQEISRLVQIFYSASNQKNPLAVSVAQCTLGSDSYTLFFDRDDVPALAAAYSLDLPNDIDRALQMALQRGAVIQATQQGTGCSLNNCAQDTGEAPHFVYSYNPNMLKMDNRNAKLLNNQAFINASRTRGTSSINSNFPNQAGILNKCISYGQSSYIELYPRSQRTRCHCNRL